MDTHKLNFTLLDIELLSFLCTHIGEKLSQREIAKAIGVSPTAVANSIKNLKRSDLVTINKTKTINFTSLNRDNPKAVKLKKIENQKQIYLSGLSDFLEEKLPGATIILFGSYSKGEDIITSDIDLAVIGRKEKNINLQEFEKVLYRKINLNFYDSWKNIHKNLKNNILSGIVIQGGVDL